MPRKISLINYKGGVGKTSLIVNTAACLAEMGNRVLLFDLDTQSNASIWLMRLERWNVLQSSGRGDIFSIFDPAEDTLKDCIIKDVVQDKSGKSILPGLDIVPTTFNLVDVENEYKAQRPPYAVFQEQLAEIEDNYDYILFDCPPNVLRAAQCGIFCSNEVYIPSNPDALSLIGFTLLVDKMLKFHQRSASFRKPGMGKPAQVQGIIFNAIKKGVDIDVPKMRMQFRLNQFKKQKRVGASAKIFSSIVRDAIVVRRAVTLGLPINLVGQVREEEDSVYKDYVDVAEELINHKPS
ncbi:MAG: AAA family ATPase [Opitutales bacterium]|nr:AAA family ATPase [Opitutales bacterium]MCH8540612.1 AAA family ATPase [Opitutales bacterium]